MYFYFIYLFYKYIFIIIIINIIYIYFFLQNKKFCNSPGIGQDEQLNDTKLIYFIAGETAGE